MNTNTSINSILSMTNPYPYKRQKCCICHRYFNGYGNNPAPVEHSGRCCDDCNKDKVIPSRRMRYYLGLDIYGEV